MAFLLSVFSQANNGWFHLATLGLYRKIGMGIWSPVCVCVCVH